MIRFFTLICLIILPLQSWSEEWVPLFDGESTNGWTPRTTTTVFEVKDGQLHLDSDKNCWVTTHKAMSDFEAEVEVLLPSDAKTSGFNSGLAFRCVGKTGKPKGYQVEIDGKNPGMSGGVYGIGLGGWIHPKKTEKEAFSAKLKGVVKDGEWNRYRVICQGSKITTYINDVKIAETEDDKSLKGYFAIQHHGKGGIVKFRNIRARALPAKVADVPNILWITAEDMSPALSSYGDKFSRTPNLDQFAKESVLYTRAFAASPVCSPSRSTLITGIYNASMGTNQMRSAHSIPTGVVGFPSFLRKAGFYTSNQVKTDYNCAESSRLTKESWNESSPTAHWQSKKAGQPFFSVFNDMTTHQSRTMVWPYKTFQTHIQSQLSAEEISDPDAVPIPPYYPENDVVKKTMARFYDCVSVMDKNVKKLLDQLEADGLAEETIVFFYSDHGSGMPRHKRLLHDSGMRVPLMVRFPEKYQHLAPAKPGSRLDRLVSFVDFPATVLNLTGQTIPDYMQGKPFLGKDSGSERSEIYGTRDRVDEVYEMSRSVRNKRYLYIRNYLPHNSYNQPSAFSDLGKIRQSITKTAATQLSEMSAAQQAYAGPSKPIEEFYDCDKDPHNISNLLTGDLSAEEKQVFDQLKNKFHEKRLLLKDVGVLPESVMVSYTRNEKAPIHDVLLGKTNHAPNLKEAWEAADLVGAKNRELLLGNLKSTSDAVRFWSIIGMRVDFPNDTELHHKVADHTEDIAPSVRIETAAWLAEHSEQYRQLALERLIADTTHIDWWVALRACRAIELLGETAKPLIPQVKELYSQHRNQKGDRSLFIAFSAGAFLDQMNQETIPWNFAPSDPAIEKQ